MSKVERLRDRARTAEARDPRAAIDTWLEVLRFEEDDAEPNPDLSIYNRIGDLYLKIKDPGQAADYYERGVDRYAELGFHNNAIALCNKVLRNAPGRPTTYLKLAKLYAAKGFHAEARQNFVEYAERMKRAGQVDRAFAALKQVTDLSPESDSLRRMLEEHLRTYGDVKGRPGRPSTIAEAPPPPTTPEPKTAKRKTSSLVFLDLDEPKPGRDAPAPMAKAPPPPAAKAAASPHAPPAPAAKPAPRAPEPRKGGQDLEYVGGRESAGVEPLAVEPTAVGEDAVPPAASALEGLETTSFDFHEVRRSLTSVPRIADDQIPDVAVPTLGGLEPTAEPEPDVAETGEPTIAGFEEEATVVEPRATAPPVTPEPRRATPPPAPPRRTTPPARHAPPEPPAPPRREAAPAPPRREAAPAPPQRGAPPAPPAPPRREAPPAPPPLKAAPAAPPRETPPAAPRERPPVEVPPLEMEPEFESTGAGPGHDIDDEPLLVDSDDVSSWIQREDQITAPPPSGRSQGFIDLGVEGITIGDAYHPRVIGSGALPGDTRPTFISLDATAMPGSIPIRGMRIGENGVELKVGQAYRTLDTTIADASYSPATGQQLSSIGTVVALEKGPAEDLFFLCFDVLGSNQQVCSGDATPVAPPVVDDVPQPDIGIKVFDDINASMAAVTGVSPTTTSVANTYNTIKQALPTAEAIEGFSSSQQAGITQLAVAYCNSLSNNTQLRGTVYPGFTGWGSSAATAFSSQAQRDAIIVPLYNRAVGVNLTSQPSLAAVSGELNALITRLLSGGANTPTVVTAVCAATVGSAVTTVQ